MSDVIQVSTTCSNREEAEKIARHLVAAQLAACVQVEGPIHSVYRWQGAIEQASEWRAVAKTLRSKFAEVEAAIRHLHSYEQPEIIAVAVVAGSDGYLQWVWNETADAP